MQIIQQIFPYYACRERVGKTHGQTPIGLIPTINNRPNSIIYPYLDNLPRQRKDSSQTSQHSFPFYRILVFRTQEPSQIVRGVFKKKKQY